MANDGMQHVWIIVVHRQNLRRIARLDCHRYRTSYGICRDEQKADLLVDFLTSRAPSFHLQLGVL